MIGKDIRTEHVGSVHFTNEQISGVYLQFYHVPHETKENLFGARVVLPKEVIEKIDLGKMKSGEHEDGYYTMGQIMEVAVVLCRQAQLHPNCVEVENFDGSKHDVSDIGLGEVLEAMMGSAEEVARTQFEQEKAKGMIPDGMSFDDWIEVAGPDDMAKDRMIN